MADQLTVGGAPAFFVQFGVAMTPAQAVSIAGPLSSANASVANHAQSVDELDRLLDSGDVAGVLSGTANAILRVIDLFDSLPALGTAVGALPGAPPGFAGTFPQRLFDHLVTELVIVNRGTNEVLEFLGVLDREDVELPGPGHVPYTISTLHPKRITDWLHSPSDQLKSLFDWGTPGFDGTKLLQALDLLLGMLGLPALLDLSGPVPKLDLAYAEIRPRTDLNPAGVGITLDAGSVPVSFETTGPGYRLVISIELALSRGAGVIVQPDGTVTVELPPATAAAGTVRVTLALVQPDDRPLVLFGTPGGSRLEAREISFEVDASLRQDGSRAHGSFGVAGSVRKGKLVLDFSQGDGFLTKILGGTKLDTDFEVGFSYSLDNGLHFHGSGALVIQLPTHITLGPIEVLALTLSAQLGGEQIPIFLATDFRATLGPLTAAVEGIGLGAVLAFADGNQGNLGPLDVSLAFRPPRGVGLAVNAGVVTGGGFLYLDPDAGEYAGALELEFADFLALKAIGLITTRMPDGSTGFSLLLVITAEFPGGLQLGYGFKLIGVGGVIGLNRGMRLDAIMEGVRTGAIESVMFPHDVVANAPRILSDLKAFFPPQDGIFLIGPMAKLGWGTPTLVSVSLGVIIEIPGNIAILGVLKVALPTEDEAILLLQVNFAGAIEFDKKRIYFFASLYHSRILTITIEGELGLLVAYGEQPDFVLTVGGFHPAFKPPPLPFPAPRRISINILNTDVAHIGVDGYFAVTSNTAQFGAHAELFFGFSVFSIEGHIGFDALFQFSPFKFVIGISAGVSVKVFGIGLFSVSLDFTLSGPTPWEAKGSASISLLFFSISVDFDVTWGEDRDTTLPPVNVLPLLAAELTKPESWRTRAPVGGAPLVNLRALAENEADIVLHPLGTLFVAQRVVPLSIRVDKVGSERAADVSRCQVNVDGGGLVKVSDAVDMFALAQFQNLSDAQKLSLPSFEREHAGLELSSDGAAMASSRAVRRSARYEEIIIDSVGRQANHFVSYNSTLFHHFLGGASVTRSPLAQAERALRQPFGDRITVPGDSYVVASTRDNTAAGPVFSSQAQARAHLDTLLAADPNRVDSLHVIPAMEVAA